MPPEKQTLLDAIPVTGRIPYEELHRQLQSTGQQASLAHFHQMRRTKEIVAEIDPTDRKLYVSRVAG